MVEIGYALSSEEHRPDDLVRNARTAEEAGFSFALISDHYHPWTDRQGQSPFVWSVIGAIASRTTRIRLGTGVTCPLIRLHPAIVAQAAATSAAMMPDRFFLGVGTGENLNEHITGERWPPADMRLDMLEESVEVIRKLWTGEDVTHRGRYFTVEQARIYTLPEKPPDLYMAAAAGRSAKKAGELADGIIATSADKDVIQAFEENGGRNKPRIGMLHVCFADDEGKARRTAHEWWPNSAIKGELGQELPLPRHFEQAAGNVSEDDVAESLPCGPDPERYFKEIDAYVEAGFDQVYLHQVGPDQEAFIEFCAQEILPRYTKQAAA